MGWDHLVWMFELDLGLKVPKNIYSLPMSARKCCGGCALSNFGSAWCRFRLMLEFPGMRWSTASLMMVQKVSSATSATSLGCDFYLLNFAFCPNAKLDGTEQRWAGMLFQSLLLCSSTAGSVDWRQTVHSIRWCPVWCQIILEDKDSRGGGVRLWRGLWDGEPHFVNFSRP
jgi:hypothetical protein